MVRGPCWASAPRDQGIRHRVAHGGAAGCRCPESRTRPRDVPHLGAARPVGQRLDAPAVGVPHHGELATRRPPAPAVDEQRDVVIPPQPAAGRAHHAHRPAHRELHQGELHDRARVGARGASSMDFVSAAESLHRVAGHSGSKRAMEVVQHGRVAVELPFRDRGVTGSNGYTRNCWTRRSRVCALAESCWAEAEISCGRSRGLLGRGGDLLGRGRGLLGDRGDLVGGLDDLRDARPASRSPRCRCARNANGPLDDAGGLFRALGARGDDLDGARRLGLDLAISAAMVPAACWDSSASLRTSSATTAKPRPCSPARAASMAALRASRFVWPAMAVIVSTIPPISSDFDDSVRMASHTSLDDSRTVCIAGRPRWRSRAAAHDSRVSSAARPVSSVEALRLLHHPHLALGAVGDVGHGRGDLVHRAARPPRRSSPSAATRPRASTAVCGHRADGLAQPRRS